MFGRFVPVRLSRRRVAARRVVAQVCVVALVAILGFGVVLVGTTPASAVGTTLVSESFTGSTVADPNFIALNSACLTQATAAGTGGALGKCATTSGPVPLPADNGWLRLTDAATFVQGGVVYNRAVPAAAGLVVEFDQAQYGGTVYTGSSPSATGDGIGFFLSDGTYNLTSTGAYGGALGYAQRSGTGSGDAQGAVGGYLGVGLDVYGNYSNDQEGRGTGCNAANAGTRTTNAVVLRGPGRLSGTQWTQGYCRVGTSNQLSPAYNQQPSLYYSSTVRPTAATEAQFVRKVRVTVDAQDATSTTGPRVTVELKFPGETTWGHATTTVMPTRAPATYKFGWAASTGGATDIHLIRNVTVSSLEPLSDLTIAKQVAGTMKDKYVAGDVIPYQFLVYNTGTTSLTGIAVSDPLITSVSCPSTTLAAGASTICTGSYTVTAANVAAGPTLTNTATARGTLPGGTTSTSQPSSVTVPLQNIPRITLIKTPSRSSGVAVGDTITYSFLVTNTGNVTVQAPRVVDGTATYCTVASLAAGVSTTCTGPTRTVTQANVDAGQVTNTATASATYNGSTVTDVDTAVVPTVAAAPALTLVKSASPTSGVVVGSVITYGFSVTNSGNVTVSGVGVTDAGTRYTCTSPTLAPLATTTCTAPTRTVTQADVDAGGVTNTATASGTAPGGAAVTSPPSTVSVPTVAAAPGLAIVKTATPAAGVRVGDIVTYGFTVTNTGNVTVGSVVVTDAGVVYPCAPTSLAPSAATTSCPGPTHTVTQADVDAGRVRNTATASGTAPGNVPVASDPTTIDVSTAVAAPSLSLVKSASPNANVAVGVSVTYSFVVTNNGNVTIGTPTVTDAGVTYSCPAGSLAPAASRTCTGPTHVVTQSDVDTGSITNTAVAKGTRAGGITVTSPSSTVVVTTVAAAPALSIVKSVSPGTGAVVGTSLAYSFVVTNTGNVTVHGVGVTDHGSANTCPASTLAPAATTTCAGPTHVVTQADVDAGTVSNTATAAGLDPDSSPVASAPSTVVVTFTPAPALTIVKSATRSSGLVVGDPITYSFAVTNSGNVTMHSVVVTDAGVLYSCPNPALAPGASMTCAGPTVTVVQADVDAGKVTNTATASGNPPTGAAITSPPSTVVITAAAATPAVSLVKSATPTAGVALGDTVTYAFAVTNTGNVTVRTPFVTDAGVVYPCPATSLLPTEQTTCTGPTHVVTQAEVDAGKVTNTAVASATPFAGGSVSSAPSTVTVPTVAAAGALTLLKSASPTAGVALGGQIAYSFTVTNSGNVTVLGISVTDAGVSYPCTPADLAPAQSATCAGPTHTVTQLDVDAGGVSNTATAAGTDRSGAAVPSLPATVRVSTVAPAPGLALVKSSDVTAGASVGDVLTYSFAVTNTGNVTIGSVAVLDAGISYPCVPASLAPGQVAACAGPTHTVTQADVDAGRVRNVAKATGTDPSTSPVASPSTTLDVTTAVAGPALAIVKSATPASNVAVGDVVAYSFVVTNIGNVTISSVGVTDDLVGYACPSAPLAPGASATCAGPTHPVTQADVDRGSISNTATASGTGPGPVTVTSQPSTVVVSTVGAAPELTLVKSVTPSTGVVAGTSLAYSFLVTNTGNVTLHGVGVTDATVAYGCPDSTLTPGQSTTCTGPTHVVTQAEVDAGTISNTATASGKDPLDVVVDSVPSTVTLSIAAVPALSVVKSVTPSSGAVVGTELTYAFAVQNTGTVTLTGVAVLDAGVTYACAASALAPGDTTTCTGPSHVVTQGDVDAGSISNTATASGQAPAGGGTITSPPSTVDVTFAAAPALALVKTVAPSTGAQVGTTLVYSFAVTNSGNVTVDGISVTDDAVVYDCLQTALLPTQSTTCAGPSHVVTQADVDAGVVHNTATATGADPADAAVESDPASVDVTIPASPGLTLVKSVLPASGAVLGDVLTYSFAVSNTGNVTIADIAVTDAGASYSCAVASLAPGEDTTCAGPTHTVTQADVDSGRIENTAIAEGSAPGGSVNSDPSTATVLFAAHPALALVKSATPDTGVAVGDQIAYSFAVTNIGNVTIGSIVVTDDGSTYPCTPASLTPLASVTCAGPTHTVTQDDVDAGVVTNTATATGADPSDTAVSSTPSTVRVSTVVAGAGLAVVKSSDLNAGVGVGDVITYGFAVTNIGNVTVGSVVVTDAGTDYPCAVAVLAPTESTTCAGPSHTVTQADVDTGVVTNTATASGTDPDDAPVTSQPATHDVTTVAADPVLGLVKSADVTAGVEVGDTVTYGFVVTNHGNVTLHDVVVTDGGTDYSCAATLAPAASTSCAGPVHTVTQADVDAGSISNTATAAADPPSGAPVGSGPSTVVVDTVVGNARLTLVKSADVTTGVAGRRRRHLHVRGHEQRQRDDLPRRRPGCGHQLLLRGVGARAGGEHGMLRPDARGDAGRRRHRLGDQHRRRRRPGPGRRDTGVRPVDGRRLRRRRRAVPRPGQGGVGDERGAGGRCGPLHVRGHEHRQRHALGRLGGRRRRHLRLRHDDSRTGRVRDVRGAAAHHR